MVVSFGQWPYGDKPVWVCSSKSIDAIEGCNLQNETAPLNVCNEARKQGIKHLWLIGGGKLAA